jgi:hypothetical protein
MRGTSLSFATLISIVHSLLLVVLSVLLLMGVYDLHESGEDVGKVGQVG